MPDLRSQRAVAARAMKCGKSRVWMDPARSADIAEAITADDVRHLINDGVIKIMPKTGVSRYRKNVILAQKRKGRRKGKGSRKGKLGTRYSRKGAWMSRIRTIRRLLRELKSADRIDGKTYRSVYRKSKSGFFRSKSHVTIYLERNNLLKKQNDARSASDGSEKKKV